MKKSLLILAIVLTTFSGHASEGVTPVQMTLSPIFSPFMITGSLTTFTSMGGTAKVAHQIINDGQEFALTGELSPFLSEGVSVIQAQFAELSSEEAVDLLFIQANEFLNTIPRAQEVIY